jgi:hypothetical protein
MTTSRAQQHADLVMSRSEERTKLCVSCGREMVWRKSWARNWDSVRFCSDSCRRRAVSEDDRALEELILSMLASLPRSATLCPSEVARRASDDWRPLMEPVRRAARRLVADGRVEICQGGHVVDPSRARGPIRIRRVF